jgi:hypothetical protein
MLIRGAALEFGNGVAGVNYNANGGLGNGVFNGFLQQAQGNFGGGPNVAKLFVVGLFGTLVKGNVGGIGYNSSWHKWWFWV